jgi:proline iminopeptidase
VSFAEVNGTKLFHVESGRGIPFIAVHGGLGYDHAYLRNALAPAEDLARVIYFDQRGNGRSDPVPMSTITFEQLAADIDALREEFGFDRIGVIGHSYGGFVAQQYATTYPDRVSHLVLLSTSPGAFEATDAELAERGDRSWIGPQVQAALDSFAGPAPSTNEEFLARIPQIAPAYARGDAAVIAAELGRAIVNVDALKRGFEILRGWSVVDKLDSITAPTLVACGRHDLLTTPECSARLASAIPNAELAWFENSGHFPWLEEPQAFNNRLRDFLVDHW